MLPIALPVLLAAVRASTNILNATPMDDWIAWVQILLVVDIVYMVMCFWLFEFVIEE
jgi:ABC-type transport system involved in cytochrome c biogenesis permease component